MTDDDVADGNINLPSVAKMVTEGNIEKNSPAIQHGPCVVGTVETFSIEEQGPEKKSTLISPLLNITVEPIIFLYALASSISSVISSNFYIERICRVQLNYSSNYCQDLLIHAASAGNNTTNAVEEEIATIVSTLGMYESVITFVFPVGVAFFMGPWSDKHGSKFPLLLSLFGSALSVGLCALFAYLDELPPIYLILTVLPGSLCGGSVTLVIAIMSFMSSVAGNDEDNERNFRFSMLDVAMLTGEAVGFLGGAKLYKALGFAPVYLIASGCYALAFSIGLVLIKQPKRADVTDKGACIRDMFNIQAVRDTLTVIFAKREPPKRVWLWLSVSIMSLQVFSAQGISTSLFLFMRHQFSWNEQDLSMYSTIDCLLGVIGSVVMAVVGLKLLKLSGTSVAMISTASLIAYCGIIACAPQDTKAGWMLYAASGVSMFGGMTTTMIRSMIGKIVPQEDVGKVFTFCISTEVTVVPLIASTSFSLVYMSTQSVFPGAFSAISGVINAVVLIMIIYVCASMRKNSRAISEVARPD